MAQPKVNDTILITTGANGHLQAGCTYKIEGFNPCDYVGRTNYKSCTDCPGCLNLEGISHRYFCLYDDDAGGALFTIFAEHNNNEINIHEIL